MENLSTAGARWELHSVLGYIKQVEICYGVSLKFWLDFRPAGDSNTELFVFAWGSGTAFDLLPDRFAPRPTQIHPSEENYLGEAIYYAVKYLETGFHSVREPLGARPSL
jgi:hypothetical protein